MLRQIGYGLTILAVGVAAGYWLMPKKVIVKEKIKYTDRVTVVVKKPDGTTETRIEDKSRTVTDEKTTVNAGRNAYNLSLMASTDFKGNPSYGLSVDKEFLGPITVGVFATTSRTLGLRFGLNF